jgi:hypothetical protein
VEAFGNLSFKRERIKGSRSRWLDKGGATRERLTLAAEEWRQAAKNPMKSQAATNNDSRRT